LGWHGKHSRSQNFKFTGVSGGKEGVSVQEQAREQARGCTHGDAPFQSYSLHVNSFGK
jgi:hypothetical protein